MLRVPRSRWLRVPVLIVLLAAACARRSDLMDAARRGVALQPVPPDKAIVVFLRPAYLGYLISAAVYEDDEFLGIVMRHSRLVRETSPGTHRFMVVSEAADFLDAELDAGKIYFVEVAPRMGAGRARFTLVPMALDRDLRGWLDDSYPVTTNAAGHAWARDNQPSVTEKKENYLRKWLQKPERPALRPTDGVPHL
jgi:hypothetical protein